MFKRITIRTNILLHFLFLLLTLSAALIGAQYYYSKALAKEAIGRTFHQTAHKIALSLKDEDRLSKEILYQIESHPAIATEANTTLPMDTIRHFIHTLERHPTMYAIYLGYRNGDFFEVINMGISPTIHAHYKAPPATRWTIIKIYDTPDEGRVRAFLFLDEMLKVISERTEPSKYYVTSRAWYLEALKSKEPVRSDAYLFSNLRQKGITYSKRLNRSDTVLALDFTTESMHRMLKALRFSQSGNIYLYGRDGKLISSSEEKAGTISQTLAALIAQGNIDTIETLQTDEKKRYGIVIPLTKEMGKETFVGISIDTDELLTPYKEKIYYALGIALLLILISIPVTLYLTDRLAAPVKALMAENDKIKARKFDMVKPVKSNIVEMLELSDSQIAMSQSIQTYEKQLEELLDTFIKIIADTIDAKSAYTGAHCQRVPVIAMMLAEAAEAATEGPFKAFEFSDQNAKKAFERAAWLHDCGKITTPEYVVDKATKLETIYNRIHEIRTRFEVIWRDIEISGYRRILKGDDEKAVKQWIADEQQRLQEEFALVAASNYGSERMKPEQIARIKEIAKRTWMRHFDDRLGLSEAELRRYGTSSSPLPAKEYLLDDKPYHFIARENFDHEKYRMEHFKLQVPDLLYNRGELYNLCIEKGTLTPEERYKINEHVIMTIKMLESLPFPEEMKEIPKMAGEHHETMDGKGYPRRLNKQQISIPSRIMAIADIFEALTASDRPYKKSKKLSEALQIMYRMKQEKHIDADLFDLFIVSGVYMKYAQAYLKPEQIDQIDESSLLG